MANTGQNKGGGSWRDPKSSIHWSIRTDLSLTPPVIFICATILAVLFAEEPDIIDAIIQMILFGGS